LPQKKQRFKGDVGVISAAMRRDADVPQKPVLSRQGQGVTSLDLEARWCGGRTGGAGRDAQVVTLDVMPALLRWFDEKHVECAELITAMGW
jgi:hypothetical protein